MEGFNAEQPNTDSAEETNEEGNSGQTETFALDGKEYTAEEMREYVSGGLRQADYTKKTQELADLRKEYESAQAAPSEPEKTFDDPMDQLRYEFDQEIKSIREESADIKLDRDMSQARSKYPNMVEDWVLAHKYNNPNASVEALAKESQEFLESKVQAYMDAKKKDQTATIKGGSSGPTSKAKEYKVPKNKATGKVDWSALRNDAYDQLLKN